MKRKHLLEKIKSLGGFHVEDLKSKLVSTIMDSLSDEQSKDINHVKIKDDVRRFLSKAQEKYKKYCRNYERFQEKEKDWLESEIVPDGKIHYFSLMRILFPCFSSGTYFQCIRYQ